MDNQILRDLFTQVRKSYDVLKENKMIEQAIISLQEAGIVEIESFIDTLTNLCNKLIPTKISDRGTILEWQEDYEKWEPGHRHLSHLYGLHPSEHIPLHGTPEWT